MKSLTSSNECIVHSSDETYLTWNEMNVTIFGTATSEEDIEVKEVCKKLDPLHRVIFPAGILHTSKSKSKLSSTFLTLLSHGT